MTSEPMETARAQTPTPPPEGRVLSRLLEHGCEFDFFQAVWLLERACRDRAAVGGRGPVAGEPLRFRPCLSLAFPSADVRSVARRQNPDGSTCYQVESTFLGLYGVSTPLPLHYAVQILRSVENAPAASEAADTARGGEAKEPPSSPERDFLDLLHHRLLSLFYRSWTKYRYHVTFGMPQRDTLTGYLLWLIGCQPDWGEGVLGVPPLCVLRYAGLLTQRPRSAAALEGLLRDYTRGVPVTVTQAVGRWVTLHEADLNRAGVRNSRLGEDCTVGEQVYDLNGAFQVTLGPLDWETYVSYLPDAPAFAETESVVQLFCTDPLSFTIELKLLAGQVPEMRLSSDAGAGRLGFTSWVRTRDMPETAVVFQTTRWNGR